MIHRKVANGNVTLPVSESGQGPTLVFLNGAGATQASWNRTIRALGGSYRLVTSDFRSHGTATRSPDTSFDGFLSDAEAIMDQVAGPRPIVVGWSLGADLAVWYAAAHPGKVAGLFLIDGAIPVNLVTDPAETRRRLIYNPAVWYSPWVMYLAGMGYRLTPPQMATLTIEVNARREQLLSAYQHVDCPVELVLATKTARGRGASAAEKNARWRAGGEELTRLYPEFALQWVENTHLLPFTEPIRLARSVDAFVQRILAGLPSVQAGPPIPTGDQRPSPTEPGLKTQRASGTAAAVPQSEMAR